jgi:hypothetical protein
MSVERTPFFVKKRVELLKDKRVGNGLPGRRKYA